MLELIFPHVVLYIDNHLLDSVRFLQRFNALRILADAPVIHV